MQLTDAQKRLLSNADKGLGIAAATMIHAVEVVCGVSREAACATVAHLLNEMALVLLDEPPMEPVAPKGDSN